MRGLLVLAILLAAPPAAAGPGVPGPDYFKGLYMRVGRDAADPPAAFADMVRLEPAGVNLRLRACSGAVVPIRFDPYGDAENAMIAQDGEVTYYCLFHNNGQNYPLVTCEADSGALFTLWPVEPDFADAPLACEN